MTVGRTTPVVVSTYKCHACKAEGAEICTTNVCETEFGCLAQTMSIDGQSATIYSCHTEETTHTGGAQPSCETVTSDDGSISSCTCTAEFCFQAAADAMPSAMVEALACAEHAKSEAQSGADTSGASVLIGIVGVVLAIKV